MDPATQRERWRRRDAEKRARRAAQLRVRVMRLRVEQEIAVLRRLGLA